MQRIYVMVGLPGSGKSTIAEEIAKNLNTCVISSDMIRKDLTGDENNQEQNDQVFKLYYTTLKGHLRAGHNIVLDATNTTLKVRRKIFTCLDEFIKDVEHYNLHNYSRRDFEVIAYVIPTPFEECISRDKNRERSVGRDVIDKFRKSFQFPQKFEGFDQIFVFGYGDSDIGLYDQYLAYSVMQLMAGFDQKNPHHKFDLLKHCLALGNICMKDPVMSIAGIWHDVGKLFTQQVDEEGIAHYFSHDSVGTYYLLDKLNIFGLSNWDDIYEVLFYINYHMRAHKDLRNSKAERKYRNLFGNSRYDRLIDFANKDMIASGTFEEYGV